MEAGAVGIRGCPALRWGVVRAAYGVVESERTGGAVGGAETRHPAGVAQGPALAGTLHPRLQHVTVRALDCAAANRQSLLPQQPVVHPSLVGAVIADQIVECLQSVGPVASTLLHLRDALHQFGDGCARAFGKQRLRALLTERETGAFFVEEEIDAIDRLQTE